MSRPRTLSCREQFIETWTEENGKPPPSRWAICEDCHGEGHNSRHLGDVTNWLAEDPDAAEDYFAGLYDQTCQNCGGSGKVREFSGEAETAWADWQQEAYDDYVTRMHESGIYTGLNDY